MMKISLHDVEELRYSMRVVMLAAAVALRCPRCRLISGYFSARIYRTMKGRQWKQSAFQVRTGQGRRSQAGGGRNQSSLISAISRAYNYSYTVYLELKRKRS